MSNEQLRPRPRGEKEKTLAQEAYSRSFVSAVASRLLSPVNTRRLNLIEAIGFQVSLAAEADQAGQSIELPTCIQAIIDSAFTGYPINEQTHHPEIWVRRVAFYLNRAVIDVAPKIETPPRRGIESQFIGYPDHSKAIYERLGFYIIPQGYCTVYHGNPHGPSEWVQPRLGPAYPYQGKRYDLTPETIRDFAALVSAVNAREHSDLIIHKAHT